MVRVVPVDRLPSDAITRVQSHAYRTTVYICNDLYSCSYLEKGVFVAGGRLCERHCRRLEANYGSGEFGDGGCCAPERWGVILLPDAANQ